MLLAKLEGKGKLIDLPFFVADDPYHAYGPLSHIFLCP